MVNTKGGKLNVEYDRVDDDSYKNIWLSGPAEKVFLGEMELEVSLQFWNLTTIFAPPP